MPQVGVIGVDGGVTSGLAWGRFNPELRDRTSLWRALARGRGYGWAEINEGEIIPSGLAVVKVVMDRIADWNISGMGTDQVFVIIEDFQARLGDKLVGGTARDKLAPVFVAGILAGALAGSGWGKGVRFVMPALAKSKVNDERLKRWGQATNGRAGWVRGKVHGRDAWRLLATGFEEFVT